MSTTTRTGTETTTITAGDVRQVMALTTEEITTICERAARVARDFDVDGAMVDCSIMALNDVICAIRLQLYREEEIVREYSYTIADAPLAASGPPADQPPIGSVPEGTRVRLIVETNDRVSTEVVQSWFRRLGWTTAKPLRRPAGVQAQTYGTFVSGGYGVERQLLVNPKYDRPAESGPVASMRKEGAR
jgi:hypothetical protein